MRRFATTEGVPPPTAHPLVEEIVSRHFGKFRVLDEVERDGRNLFAENEILTANQRKMETRAAELRELESENSEQIAALEAQVAALTAEVTRLDSVTEIQNTLIAEQTASFNSQFGALSNTIGEMMAQIDALTPPPPDAT